MYTQFESDQQMSTAVKDKKKETVAFIILSTFSFFPPGCKLILVKVFCLFGQGGGGGRLVTFFWECNICCSSMENLSWWHKWSHLPSHSSTCERFSRSLTNKHPADVQGITSPQSQDIILISSTLQIKLSIKRSKQKLLKSPLSQSSAIGLHWCYLQVCRPNHKAQDMQLHCTSHKQLFF